VTGRHPGVGFTVAAVEETAMRAWFESVFYDHLYGDWDSLQRWAWVYLHVGILLATALAGYAVARQRYLLALLLVPFPLVFLYRRYTYARPG